eukprot:EG_transcript_23785
MGRRQLVLEALPSLLSIVRRLPPEALHSRAPVACRLAGSFRAAAASTGHYRHLCGFEGGRYLYPSHLLPPTLLQAETYTLQAAAARCGGFDLADLQLVRYRLTQARPISVDEPLDVSCEVDVDDAQSSSITLNTRFTAQGSVVSAFTTAYSAGYHPPEPHAPRNWQSMGNVGSTLLLSPSLGFNYCRRGFGPFSWRHLSILTAVLSGKPHAEVPEAWLAGRLLAALAGDGWLTLADGGPIELDLAFHGPVPAPSRIFFMVCQNAAATQPR